jgi:hypothetical protein
LLFFSFALVLFLACSKETPPEQRAEDTSEAGKPALADKAAPSAPKGAARAGKQYSLEIFPRRAVRTSALQLRPRGFELAEAKVVWLLNGDPVSTVSLYRLDAPDIGAGKGDHVQAKATVGDVEVLSNGVTIRNSLPELTSVKLTPEAFRPGDTIGVEAEATDGDGDNVIIEYEWTKNGEPAGTGTRIGDTLKKGDKFAVKVIPFDGEEYGQEAYLERKILNLPPMVVEDYSFVFRGNTFSFRATAKDPDGDPVTYSLKSGPEGMTVEAATGIVMWKVPPEVIGKTSFTLAAKDGHGGVAEMNYTFTLSEEKKEK